MIRARSTARASAVRLFTRATKLALSSIEHSFGQDSDLRRWGRKMIEAGNASKRALQRAVVGVARRLAVLLMSLWKSGQTYDPLRHSRARGSSQEVAA